MPAWLKGRSAKREKDNGYENADSSQEKDPFSDVGYYTSDGTRQETYSDGIAPVTISIDESNEARQLQHKRLWKQQIPTAMFVDQDGKEIKYEKNQKTVGSGDLVGTTSDLDTCCIQDGTLGCLGFDKIVLCSGKDIEQYTQLESSHSRDLSDIGNSNNDGDIERIQSICPAKSGDESTTASTHELNKIRSMGPIRDGEGNVMMSMKECMNQCVPKTSPEKESSFIKRKFRYILVILLIFLIALIAGIVAVALRKQVKPPTDKDKQTGGNEVSARETQLKSLLGLQATKLDVSSPQGKALRWMVDEDPPAALASATRDEARERFAAATLYYATNGPETWKSSLGFVGENSICEWSTEGVEESIGIFCQNGRVDVINIVDNGLSGSLPNELNYFTEIIELNLFYNEITGPIPDLSAMIKLEQLDLDTNKLSGLTGTIPEIEDTSKLVAVSLLDCSFSGTLPKSLGIISSLRLLQLKGNNIGGPIPNRLMSSPNIETLGLEGNRLSGTIPPVVLTNEGSAMKILSIGSNNLDGSLPFGLSDLNDLKYFFADDNKLTGSVLSTIRELPNLEQVSLQGNSLSEDISFFLSDSMVLTDVYLGGNKFSGDLQDFLTFAPPSLERLDLSKNNGIEGSIPDGIANFGKMKYFNVSSCSIGGIIPSEIGKLRKLEILDLSRNNFRGDVPREMADMESIIRFDISQNRNLGGELTSSLCKKRFDIVFSQADCSGDARVGCECCTHCCNKEGVCSSTN